MPKGVDLRGDVPATSPNSSHGDGARVGGRRWPDALVVVLYGALALLFFWNDWSGGPGHVIAGGNDVVQMTWFFNWVPYALGHGLNPFHSSLASFPEGVNLLNNTSAEFLGLIMAPVTLLFGPVASLTVVDTLALAGSAISMYFVVRRFTHWRPAAFVAGLIVGFGPCVIGQATNHPFLTCYALPPIILLLVHDCAVRRDGKQRRRGIVLGLLLAAQFFISSEVLAMTVVMAAVLIVVMAVRGRHALLEQLPATARSLWWAACVAVLLLAYPVWYAVAGPQHVGGYLSNPALYREDLLAPIVPDSLSRLTVPSLTGTADHFASAVGENGSYLGVTLLATLIAGGVWLWRRAEVQVVSIVGVIAFIFALGPRLMIAGRPAELADGKAAGLIPLPWALPAHLPLLTDLLPSRFSGFVAMAAAFLLAVILDQLYARTRARRPAVAAALVPISVAIVALVPILPSGVPFSGVAIPNSTYFASRFADELPPGRVAVVYPYPNAWDDDAALWQTESGMRFVMPGGYSYVPQLPASWAASGPFTLLANTTDTGNALGALYSGHPPARTPALLASVRGELRSWHTASVVAVPAPGTAASVVSFISWLVGARPVHQADAYVWYHAAAALRRG
jgi:hypothetical protein